MADSSSESYFYSNIFGLRQIPSIPSLFIGFGLKGPTDADSVRSPTSPLDFKFLSSLSNSFKLKSPRSTGPQKKLDCSEVGLSIVNLIADEVKCGDEIPVLQHKHIIFGRQVKNISTLDMNYPQSRIYPFKSNSLPRNYMIMPEREARSPEPIDGSFRNGEVPLKMEFCRSRSLETGKSCSSFVEKTNFSGLHSESLARRTIPDNPLEFKETSLPIPIGEIESSEDYTCIISYGPNSKTTHIFGDCILEYYTKNNSSNSVKEEHPAEMTRVAESSEKMEPNASMEQLRFCDLCNKELRGRDEFYTDGFKKALCCQECHSNNLEQAK